MEKQTSEVWKWVPGYENRYEVSNLGRVRSWRGGADHRTSYSNKILSPWRNWNGYYLIALRRKKHALHRIVALTFHGPCPDGLECCHLNGDKSDNSADNLAYATRKENHGHKKLHGTASSGRGSPHKKLKQEDIPLIKKLHMNGTSKLALSRKFKVHPITIKRVIEGTYWSKIKT